MDLFQLLSQKRPLEIHLLPVLDRLVSSSFPDRPANYSDHPSRGALLHVTMPKPERAQLAQRRA